MMAALGLTEDLARQRNYDNIRRNFLKYLIPATVTELAASLNEFVDSLTVANLLDTKALSVVNVASVIVFVFSTLYTVLGVGGSALYSVSRGNHDRKKADEIFSASVITAFIAGVVLAVTGAVFAPQIAELIGKGSGVENELAPYIRILSCAGLPIVVSCVFVFFLPASGHPVLATVINLVSNGVNLVFDFVYIKVFNMGVNGAALATVTGFTVGLVTLCVFYYFKKDSIGKIRFSKQILKNLNSVFGIGIAPAATQIGYAIKIAFCNLTAAGYAGEDGIVAFTVCIQILSMISIFLGGVLSTTMPFAATLKGMNDRRGQKYIIRLSAVIMFAVSALFVAVMEICPEVMLSMYSVNSRETAEIVIPAIRIFSWLLLIRWIYLEFRTVISIMGMKLYALLISLADGFVLAIVFSLVLCPFMGIDGLWWSLLLPTVIIAVAVFVINKIIVARSGGKYKGFWLIADNNDTVAELTIDSELSNIDTVTSEIESVCRQNSLLMSRAMIAAISVEEMSVIVKENSPENVPKPIDVLIQCNGKEITINFCSVGAPFNSASFKEDGFTSYDMLKKISKSISYDYVLGMNITRITVAV